MRPAIPAGRSVPSEGQFPQSSLCGHFVGRYPAIPVPQVLLPLTFLLRTGTGGSSQPTHVIFNPNRLIVLFDVVFND